MSLRTMSKNLSMGRDGEFDLRKSLVRLRLGMTIWTTLSWLSRERPFVGTLSRTSFMV